MRPKQIRTIDKDGVDIPEGRAIVTDGAGAKWSRGRALMPIIADGRLSISSGEPVPSEGTGTILYYTPYSGSIISLFDSVLGWQYHSFDPELSFDIASDLDVNDDPIVANGTYDVFIVDEGTALILELVPWTNSGGSLWLDTRVVSLTKLDGVYVKSTNLSKRYVGTFTTIGGSISFASTGKSIWNVHNQVEIGATVVTTAVADHTVTGQIVNVTSFFVLGLPTKVKLEAYTGAFNNTGLASGSNNNVSLGIRVDQQVPTNLVGSGRQRLSLNLPLDPVNNSGLRMLAYHIDRFDGGYHQADSITDAVIVSSSLRLAGAVGGDPSRGMAISYLG